MRITFGIFPRSVSCKKWNRRSRCPLQVDNGSMAYTVVIPYMNIIPNSSWYCNVWWLYMHTISICCLHSAKQKLHFSTAGGNFSGMTNVHQSCLLLFSCRFCWWWRLFGIDSHPYVCRDCLLFRHLLQEWKVMIKLRSPLSLETWTAGWR